MSEVQPARQPLRDAILAIQPPSGLRDDTLRGWHDADLCRVRRYGLSASGEPADQ